MLRGVKGPAICKKCLAVYAEKRWRFDDAESRKLAASSRTHKLICPACQKIRDDYPEGILTVRWSALKDHEAEIRGRIDNVEARTLSINPLARVMKIIGRQHDLEVHTTTDRLAQRLGRELVRAFRGRVTYRWAHRDMLVRVAWTGPERAARKR